MRMISSLMLCLGVFFFAVACGDEEELPEVDCSMEVPSYGEVTAFDSCTPCHSSELSGDERAGAPEGYNFDTWEGAQAEATHIAEEVYEGEMPPPGSSQMLTADEEQELYLWALCGAPQ